jgi:RNA polymerase sigma-70 factor (ECF subfamily)
MHLAAVYEAQLAWVLTTLRRLGVREADLDDAAHELFLVVHRKLATFDAARPLRPWLFGIAYRIARDHLRAAGRRHLEVVPLAPVAVDGESQSAARHELERIQRALDTLDDERRATFIMFELDGFTAPEIAEVLGCPLNTLYSHLRRARRHVHAYLNANDRPREAGHDR